MGDIGWSTPVVAEDVGVQDGSTVMVKGACNKARGFLVGFVHVDW